MASAVEAPARPAAARRSLALPAHAAVAALVLGSAVLHALVAWLRPSPNVFPDEYLYASLGRSLAQHGSFAVRGASAHFPALLEPLLTAPVWLVHDTALAYRLLQAESAVAMSLAAVPAYLVARRVRLSARVSVGVAALALAGPQLLLAGTILSEPFAYPLVLGAVAAALATLERPSVRAQLTFLALAGLATFDRVQLAVLAPVAVGAVVVAGLRERRLGAALREQRTLVALTAVAGVAGLVVATVHGLGYYHGAPGALTATGSARIAIADVYVVLLSAGAILGPSALVGWWLALARPRSRAELSLGAFAALLAGVLLAEAVLYRGVGVLQERYLFYLVPLVPIFFALRLSRSERDPLAEVGVAAPLAAIAFAVPLTSYVVVGTQTESPFLFALARLLPALGEPAHARVLLAALFATATAIGLLPVLAPRRATLGALAVAGAVSLAAFAAAASFDRSHDRALTASELGTDPQWVDHAAGGRAVSLLVDSAAQRHAALATLFWNRSIVRVVRLPGAVPIDRLAEPALRVGPGGTLLLHGEPLRGPVLVETSALHPIVDATVAARSGAGVLYRSTARLRAGSY